MSLSFPYRAVCRVLKFIRLLGRSDADLAVEIVMLCHEVAVLRRQVPRSALDPEDRAVLAELERLLPRHRLGHFFVQPSTLLRWHRDLVAKRWTCPYGRPGRPPIVEGTTALALRLAKENPTWGYPRIHGEFATVGIVMAAASVWAILKRHGIEPSPRRSGPTWTEFLAAQAKGLMACDFFHVDTVLLNPDHSSAAREALRAGADGRRVAEVGVVGARFDGGGWRLTCSGAVGATSGQAESSRGAGERCARSGPAVQVMRAMRP